MRERTLFSSIRRFPVSRSAAVLLAVLAWRGVASGGEIHDAARDGDVERVKTLLKDNPAEVNAKDDGGWTPLHYAVGHKEVVELLLTQKAEVNARDNSGWTPLHLARINRNRAEEELLVASGAEQDIFDAAVLVQREMDFSSSRLSI